MTVVFTFILTELYFLILSFSVIRSVFACRWSLLFWKNRGSCFQIIDSVGAQIDHEPPTAVLNSSFEVVLNSFAPRILHETFQT